MTNEWVHVAEALPPAQGTYEIKAEVWRHGLLTKTMSARRRFDGKDFSQVYAEICGAETHLITHWRAL
jgi:hypothetical protein